MAIFINETVEKLKAQYPRLFIASIGAQEFIWRELTRKEYRQINEQAKTEHELEEMVCNTAILYPKLNYEKWYAGVPGVLAPLIAETSGFIGQDHLIETLEHHRATMSQFENQAETYIKTIFPSYTFEEMQNWTVDKTLSILARAEWSASNVSSSGAGKQPQVFEKQRRAEENNSDIPQETLDSKESFRQLVQSIREQGIDPMIALAPQIIKKEPYLVPPIIGGTSQWQNEVVLDVIRQQIPTVSK